MVGSLILGGIGLAAVGAWALWTYVGHQPTHGAPTAVPPGEDLSREETAGGQEELELELEEEVELGEGNPGEGGATLWESLWGYVQGLWSWCRGEAQPGPAPGEEVFPSTNTEGVVTSNREESGMALLELLGARESTLTELGKALTPGTRSSAGEVLESTITNLASATEALPTALAQMKPEILPGSLGQCVVHEAPEILAVSSEYMLRLVFFFPYEPSGLQERFAVFQGISPTELKEVLSNGIQGIHYDFNIELILTRPPGSFDTLDTIL